MCFVFVGEGIDFATVSMNVTFLAGNTSQFFDVPLIDDDVLEPTEQFTVVIKAIHLIGEQPVPPVVIGTNTEANGTILDDDGNLCILVCSSLNLFILQLSL